jgi:hypothetical protein
MAYLKIPKRPFEPGCGAGLPVQHEQIEVAAWLPRFAVHWCRR